MKKEVLVISILASVYLLVQYPQIGDVIRFILTEGLEHQTPFNPLEGLTLFYVSNIIGFFLCFLPALVGLLNIYWQRNDEDLKDAN